MIEQDVRIYQFNDERLTQHRIHPKAIQSCILLIYLFISTKHCVIVFSASNQPYLFLISTDTRHFNMIPEQRANTF